MDFWLIKMFLPSHIPRKCWWEFNQQLQKAVLPPPFPAIFSVYLWFLIVIIILSMLQFFIVLSCLISVSVNFSTFLVIGKTSAVTYQVLGHLKTCLVLAFGYTLLRDPFSWRNILGILIAVLGMVLYSYYFNRENQRKAIEASQQLPQQVAPLFPYLIVYIILLFTGTKLW